LAAFTGFATLAVFAGALAAFPGLAAFTGFAALAVFAVLLRPMN